MPTRELFTPDGYFSLRSIRAELLEAKNSSGEKIFKDEKDLDDILTEFWFKDRETAFIALEHIYPHLKKYLEETPLANINRTSTYAYIFKDIKNHKELTEFSIECERQCKNEFTEQELNNLISGTKLTTNWLLENKIIKKHSDEKGEFYATFHHTITEFFTAQSIIDSENIDKFEEWSKLETPTQKPQTYFNQSWYGVAQFLLESNLFSDTLDFFLQIGKDNNEVVDQNFAENLSRINFQDQHDPRKDQLFSLIYNVTKNSNRWISPWAQEGIASLYTDNQLKSLLKDLHPKPTELNDIITTCNSISILGELIEKKIITKTATLNDLKNQFIEYAKQKVTSGVLQRESLSALSNFGDISIISEIAPYFKDLSKNTKDHLVSEAFLRFCYATDPNSHLSINVALNSIGSSQTKVHAWQGLKQITSADGLIYLLEKVSTNNKHLNNIIDGENIFLDTKYESTNPLFDSLSKLSKTNSVEFVSLTRKIIYQVSNLESFYPDFNRSKFVDFLIQRSLENNTELSDYLLNDLPEELPSRQFTNFIALLAHSVTKNNYIEIYQKIKDQAGEHIGSFIRNIKDQTQRETLSELRWGKQTKREPEQESTNNTHLEEFYKKLYPEPGNKEVYMTDLFEYYLQVKDKIEGLLSSKDLKHLWNLATEKGIKLIDPTNFHLKINFNTGGKNFNWSQQASFYGDMVRVVKEIESSFDFTPYRPRLIQFIPFTHSDDLVTISKIIDTVTEEELAPLNKIFLNKKNDRRYLNPESYIRFVKDLKNNGSNISSPKKVIESLLDDPKIDDWVQISAIEALPLFATIKDTILKKKLEEIGKGIDAKAAAAISSLISIYKEKTAIAKRFEQIKNLAVPKRIRTTGVAYSLDSIESEYSNFQLPKALIDIKDPKLASQFFDLLEDSLQYVTNPEYEGYVRYVNRTIEMYLTNLASPKNYYLIEQLEKTVGKSSLYWNYQLPILRVSYIFSSKSQTHKKDDVDDLTSKITEANQQIVEVSEINSRQKLAQEIMNDLKKIPIGDGDSFEKICKKMLNLVFKEYMTSTTPVKSEESELIFRKGETHKYRDLVLTNSPKNAGYFQNLRTNENVKNIVFECKYYARDNYISWKEIYQLFHYLGSCGKYGVFLNKYGVSNISPSGRRLLNRLQVVDKYTITCLGIDDIEEFLNSYIEENVESFFTDRFSQAITQYSS